jgi:hypothetical protein
LVFLCLAAGIASAQPVLLTTHTVNGADTSYFGLPLEIDFHLDANGLNPLFGVVIPLELHFSNGNIMGPVRNGQELTFFPAASAFLLYGSEPDHDPATNPDTLVIYGLVASVPGWTGADDFCRIAVPPLDTGTIDFTTTTVPPNNKLVGLDSNGMEHPVLWNAPTIVVEPCPSDVMGDVNQDTNITAADIIYLANYAFKGGPTPLPVELAGDADCNRQITASDMIRLAAYIFRSGPAPCPCSNAGL